MASNRKTQNKQTNKTQIHKNRNPLHYYTRQGTTGKLFSQEENELSIISRRYHVWFLRPVAKHKAG